MIDNHTLRQYSTLDPNEALVRITQIYKRPSLDVRFGPGRTQEWYEHFLENYHKTGLRYEHDELSADKLVLTVQIFWLNEEEWIKASQSDPMALKNTRITTNWCQEHGILNTRIRELKIDGKWWASIQTQQGDAWEYTSIGNLITGQLTALPGMAKTVLLPSAKGKNGNNL